MNSIRILIVDDHEVIHNGITEILRSEPRYQIVGHAYNGKEAVQLAVNLCPDVIFMDLSMPVMNGIHALQEIRSKELDVKVIALSQHDEKEYIMQVLKTGGDGYLLKNSKKEEFFECIETVLNKRHYLSSDISEILVVSSLVNEKVQSESEKVRLTRRELEIIQKIADDKSNHQIADELNISLRTVETHRRNLMQKLKVNTVVALLKYATINNLIDFKQS